MASVVRMVDPESRKGQSQVRPLHNTKALSHDCWEVTAWSGGEHGKGGTDELSKLEYVLAVSDRTARRDLTTGTTVFPFGISYVFPGRLGGRRG